MSSLFHKPFLKLWGRTKIEPAEIASTDSQNDLPLYLEDKIIQDWRWLALRCERTLTNLPKGHADDDKDTMQENAGSLISIHKFTCFTPRTVLEAVIDKRIGYTDNYDIIIEEFTAVVAICDTSGFTALTEQLDKQADGAECLGKCINDFFDPLIRIVRHWGGDIIKFSGDAATIVWPVDDDLLGAHALAQHMLNDNNEDTYCIDPKQACRLAMQCCAELHQTLSNFPTPVSDRFLTLHIGVGFGKVTILQVGGVMDRWEYIVAGTPLSEVAIAEPLADAQETVVSSSFFENVKEDLELEFIKCDNDSQPLFAKVVRIKNNPPRPPPPLAPIEIAHEDIILLQRYIPPAVFRRLMSGYNVFLNEIRRVAVVFIGIRGLDVSTPRGSTLANKIMNMTQKAVYTMEGSVNKFLVDDKGVLLLVMFGLPPVYHIDDPTRAVMTSLRVMDGMKALGLDSGIGIASGRVWCGTVGNDSRKEYTALGDVVNLAARLMSCTGPREILVDSATYSDSTATVEFEELQAILVKGKKELVPVFRPTGEVKAADITDISISEMHLLNWPGWKYKNDIESILLKNSDCTLNTEKIRPPLDYDAPIGPFFMHEWEDPLLPTLQSASKIGGVMLVKGSEALGSQEIARFINDITVNKLHRQCFLLSNMPTSPHINIGNVPLLAWRKLCKEMIERWRVTDSRDTKGFSQIDRDDSVYGVAKELVHPSFHWRLHEMQEVITGINFSKADEINGRNKQRRKSTTSRSSFSIDKMINMMLFRKNFDDRPNEESDYLNMQSMKLESRLRSAGGSIAPVIGSLINGFTTYESSVIILHVRSGTSMYSEMDKESWRTAQIVGKVAMIRRSRKVESDLTDLKKWRRTHCRQCLWCKGYRGTVRSIDNRLIEVHKTESCTPAMSVDHKPLLVVIICSAETDNFPEQQELVKMANKCNALVELAKLSVSESQSFMSHCFDICPQSLTFALVEYIHRITSGIPRLIYLTMKFLVNEGHLILEPNCSQTPNGDKTGIADESKEADELRNVLLSRDLSCLSMKQKNFVDTQWESESRYHSFDSELRDRQNSCLYYDYPIGTSFNKRFPPKDYLSQRYCEHIKSDFHTPSKLQNAIVSRMDVINAHDTKRIAEGFLSESEAKIIENPPSWLKLNTFDFQALERYKELRRTNTSEIQDELETKKSAEKKWRLSCIKSELRALPFVPEVVAIFMSMVDHLQADEQLAAKVASVFPSAFTVAELHSVYPRKIHRQSFAKLIAQLIQLEVLETCEAPSLQELCKLAEQLGVNVQHDLLNFTNPDHVYSSTSSSNSFLALSSEIQNDVTREGKSQSVSVKYRADSDPFPGLSKLNESESKFSSNLSMNNQSEYAITVKEASNVEIPNQNAFLRFTSIALQHVVADLLLSEERKWLTRISRRTLAKRLSRMQECAALCTDEKTNRSTARIPPMKTKSFIKSRKG